MVCKSISLSLSSFSLPLYISFSIASGIEMRIKVSSSKYTFSFVYQGYIKIKQFKKEPTSIYLTKMLTTFSLRSVCYTLFQQHLNLKMWNSRQIELHDLINICIYYIDLVDKWWDRKLAESWLIHHLIFILPDIFSYTTDIWYNLDNLNHNVWMINTVI